MYKKIIFLSVLLSFQTSTALTRIVPQHFRTIMMAINAARDTDTILVMPGTYYENLVIENKNIVIGSMFMTSGDEAYIDSTIIDGEQTATVLQMVNVTDESAAIVGLTITNGLDDFGGGMILVNSSPLISHCRIVDNRAYDSGGGILMRDNCYPILSYCHIADNETNIGGGGGAYCIDSGPVFEFCIFSNNHSDVEGGGGVHTLNGDCVFINCTITGNYADGSGGAVWCTGTAVFHVTNCIFWDNELYEISLYDNNEVTVSYSNIEGGQQQVVAYGESNAIWGRGNIDTSPRLVAPGEGDYHLRPDSPCIDAGDPRYPRDPDNTITDMGALYFDQSHGVSDSETKYPADFRITSVFPNPFNDLTSIEFVIPAAERVSLNLLDLNGRIILTAFDNSLPAGGHIVPIDASGLPAGLYFTRLDCGGEAITRKLALIK